MEAACTWLHLDSCSIVDGENYLTFPLHGEACLEERGIACAGQGSQLAYTAREVSS